MGINCLYVGVASVVSKQTLEVEPGKNGQEMAPFCGMEASFIVVIDMYSKL